MNLMNLKVLVVGLGVAGLPMVKFLHRKGATITLNDAKDEGTLAELLKDIKDIPVRKVLGSHPVDTELYGAQDLIVVSPGVPLDLPFLVRFKELNVPVLGEIELAYRFMERPIIAITGTNGKTTTTALTGAMFRLGGKKTEVVGNIGIPAIEKVGMKNEESYFIMEVSSFQLETIELFKPMSAAVLNISPDHLDRHGNLEAYGKLKFRIFENQGNNETAVINADDNLCASLVKRIKSKVCTFSLINKTSNGLFLDGSKMMIRWNDKEQFIVDQKDILIPGEHNMQNAMAAAGLAVTAGIPVEAVREALRTFRGIEHRLETVALINGVNFVNDSKATNLDAAMKALGAVNAPIILLAGGSDKHSEFVTFFDSFNQKVVFMYVYGETADQLMDTARTLHYHNIEKVAGLEEAVIKAYKKAEPGCTVLLSPACASWDMYVNFEQRGNHFKRLVHGLTQ